VCVVRVAKEMHAHGHGGNERKKRSQHPPQGPASDVAAGRMDGWMAGFTVKRTGTLVGWSFIADSPYRVLPVEFAPRQNACLVIFADTI
jgi:hypothetical protein